MEKHRYFVVLASILILYGCDNSDTDYQIGKGVLSASTPGNLRAIENESLVAEITIDDNKTTYFGRDFPDGQWRINLDVVADRTYAIEIRWLANQLLLMEERGTFYTDSQAPVITPDLDVATAGGDRFDADCDGVTNLDEISLGSDPGSATQIPCQETPTLDDPTAQLLPWLAFNFLTYEFSGVTAPVVSIRHQMQIRQTSASERTYYGMVVQSDETYLQSDGSQASARASLQIVDSPLGEDVAIFFVTEAVGAVASSASGRCEEMGNRNGYLCSMPSSVSPNRWYDLSIVQVSPSQWQGRVTDNETGNSYLIATMEMPPDSTWGAHAIDMGFGDMIPAGSCIEGFDRISVRYKDTVINDNFDISSSNVVVSPCLDLTMRANGSGWTAGSKILAGENQNYLSIGGE